MALSKDFKAIAKEHGPTISNKMKLGNSAERGKKPRMKAISDDIEAFSLSVDLAYILRIHCRFLCPHKDNRHTSMADAFDAQSLTCWIFDEGFSWKEVKNNSCFEKAVGKMGTETEEKVTTLLENSGGLLPAQVPQEMLYCTVTSTHTNLVLRIVDCEAVGIYPELCEGKCVSRAKVLRECPTFAKPIEDGLEWVVYRRELEQECPELPGFLSEAGNVGHGVHRRQTPLQTLLQVHGKIQQKKATTAEEFKAIVEEVEAVKPDMKGQVADYLPYAATFSGGSTPIFILDLDRFCKQLQHRWQVHSAQFKILAACKVLDVPEYLAACLKFAMTCCDHPSYVQRGESKVWSSSDVTAMSGEKLKPFVLEARSRIVKVKDWLATTDHPNQALVTSLRGQFEADLVQAVHKKSAGQKEKFAARADMKPLAVMDMICKEFMQKCNEANIDCSQPPWPLEAVENSTTKVTAAAEKSPTKRKAPCAILDFDNSGNIRATSVLNSGFSNDDYVKHAKTKEIYKILNIEDTGVEVKLSDIHGVVTGDELTIALSDFIQDYSETKVTVTKIIPFTDLPALPQHRLDADMVKSCVKMVMLKMKDQWKQPQVNLQISPKKVVFTEKKFKANELVLFGYSMGIGSSQIGKCPPNAYTITAPACKNTNGEDLEFFVSPPRYQLPSKYTDSKSTIKPTTDPCIVLFWQLATTEDEEEANMSLYHETHKMDCGTVSVPLMKNKKAIPADTELKIFTPQRPKPAPTKAKPAPKPSVSDDEQSAAASKRKDDAQDHGTGGSKRGKK